MFTNIPFFASSGTVVKALIVAASATISVKSNCDPINRTMVVVGTEYDLYSTILLMDALMCEAAKVYITIVLYMVDGRAENK
jgi:hypothetical protein